MATITIDEKISQAQQKLVKLKEDKRKAVARKKAIEGKASRAEDTRKKILLGAMVMHMMSLNEEAKARTLKSLDTYLRLPKDRALFGLPPLPVIESNPLSNNQ